MKTGIFSMMALAALMLAGTSCQKEGMEEPSNGEYANVTFTAQLPSGITQRAKANGPRKAYSDGKSATELYYAVYEDGKKEPLKMFDGTDPYCGTATFDGNSLSTTVTLKLATDKKYDIVFFAKAPTAPYTFSAENHNFTIDYANVKANDESLDAFYAKYDYDGTSTDNVVKLYRPFAQLNIGTSDLDKYNESTPKLTQTEVEVSANVGDALDLLDGSVKNVAKQTFKMNAIPTENFVKDGYKYLAMDYLLVSDVKQLVDVTLKSDAKATVGTYTNVPVQRNYRTNIYGPLLTKSENIQVDIVPDYKKPDYGLSVWDGSTKEVEEVDGVYEINEGSELAWIAQQTALGNGFEGMTIKLMCDIDLDNIAWTPIGDNSVNTYSGHAFKGTFDGNGMTIYNLNVKSYVVNHAAAGLFGTVCGATIKNLTLKDVTVKSSHYAGAIVGYSSTGHKNTIEGCTVDGATITSTAELIGNEYDNGDKVGGITGYVGYALIKDNTVKNATLTAYRDFGGIVGGASGNTEDTYPVVLITGNKIENVKLIVDKTHNYNGYDKQEQHNVGYYLGRNVVLNNGKQSATLSDNSGEATIVYE